jgi:HEAT repeat protein
VRTNAALLLGEIGDPRALPRLRDLAENSEDPRLQVAAAYAICRIVAPEGP